MAITEQDKRAIDRFMEDRRQLIIRIQQDKGLKASGLSARLLNVRASGPEFQLVDSAGYFEYQEYGRRPGNRPPFKKIYDWLEYKKYGISYDNDKQRRSIAWAIMKKIASSGTYTHQKGINTGVLTQAIAREQTQNLLREIAKNRTLEILTDIRRIIA